MKREFHLSVILSILTNQMITPGGLDDSIDLLDFMLENVSVQGNYYTFQVAKDICRVELLKQFPLLSGMNVGKFDTLTSMVSWLNYCIGKYGEYLDVEQISSED